MAPARIRLSSGRRPTRSAPRTKSQASGCAAASAPASWRWRSCRRRMSGWRCANAASSPPGSGARLTSTPLRSARVLTPPAGPCHRWGWLDRWGVSATRPTLCCTAPDRSALAAERARHRTPSHSGAAHAPSTLRGSDWSAASPHHGDGPAPSLRVHGPRTWPAVGWPGCALRPRCGGRTRSGATGR